MLSPKNGFFLAQLLFVMQRAFELTRCHMRDPLENAGKILRIVKAEAVGHVCFDIRFGNWRVLNCHFNSLPQYFRILQIQFIKTFHAILLDWRNYKENRGKKVRSKRYSVSLVQGSLKPVHRQPLPDCRSNQRGHFGRSRPALCGFGRSYSCGNGTRA